MTAHGGPQRLPLPSGLCSDERPFDGREEGATEQAARHDVEPRSVPRERQACGQSVDRGAAGVRRGLVTPDTPAAWKLSAFAGRLGEISGSHACSALTLAFRLVLEAQRQDEPVAWITRKESVFYPPDVAETAVDLEALPVIRAPDARLAARAADQLVRSGAFGLVVLDLGTDARVPPPLQARLVGLAKKHHAAILCLTEKGNERPSLGSLVSIRAEAARTQQVEGRYLCEARILKDKRRGPGWKHTEVCHGPDGLH